LHGREVALEDISNLLLFVNLFQEQVELDPLPGEHLARFTIPHPEPSTIE
jgi:hypothetical protein